MNLEQYIELVKNPSMVGAEHILELREILDTMPYCATTRMLLLKAMHQCGDVNYESTLARTVVYAPSPRALYYYILLKQKPQRRAQGGGDYFEMMDTLEKVGEETNQSLQELAAKLKQARKDLLSTSKVVAKEETEHVVLQEEILEVKPAERDEKVGFTEANARELIRAKRYNEALEMLEYLHREHPDNTYIADQIRFIRLIVNN